MAERRARAPPGRRRTRAARRTRRRRCRARPTGARAGRFRPRARRPPGRRRRRSSVHSCAVRQPVARQLEQLQHLVAPPPPRDVEEQRPGSVGGVDRALPGEPEADVVLRQQDVRDPRVDVRLVPAQPEQLRRREAGERAVAGQLDQALQADALLDLRALGAGALVVPEDRRPQHASSAPSATRPCIWPEKPSGSPSLPAELGERRLARPPPVLGVLLGPARLRRRERVLALGAARAPLPPARSRSP